MAQECKTFSDHLRNSKEKSQELVDQYARVLELLEREPAINDLVEVLTKWKNYGL